MLSRRQAAIGLGAGLLLAAQGAKALVSCGQHDAKGIRRCESGIDRDLSEAVANAVGGQHMSQWCWAASIEMVFRFYGYVIPQAEIVRQAWGTPVNLPGSLTQVLGSLNRNWIDQFGRPFRVESRPYSPHPMPAILDLQRNWPLIVGTMRHAMVLTSLVYDVDNWDRVAVRAATVSDPWPGAGRRILRPEEWHRREFFARIRVFHNDGTQPRPPRFEGCNPRVQSC